MTISATPKIVISFIFLKKKRQVELGDLSGTFQGNDYISKIIMIKISKGRESKKDSFQNVSMQYQLRIATRRVVYYTQKSFLLFHCIDVFKL